jgi:hypothetical protein
MTNRILPTALTLLTALVSASAVRAQVPPPSSATPAVREYRVKQVLGAKVHLQGDLAIGTVDDIVFGDDGVVEYLIVLNEGKLVTVPWQAARFNFEKRVATLAITPEQFKLVPTYTAERYPSYYAPAYRTEIYKFYGLTPRQERRLERKEIRNP